MVLTVTAADNTQAEAELRVDVRKEGKRKGFGRVYKGSRKEGCMRRVCTGNVRGLKWAGRTIVQQLECPVGAYDGRL